MKNETAMSRYSLYSLEDLFYELEHLEDEGRDAEAEKVRKEIDSRVEG
jgi:hypothetical protein